LPTIALVTIPVGWLIGGSGGAAVAFATGLVITCAYEFFHCIQHLSYKPKAPWLVEMKQRHMEHHFHDEDGNFGICEVCGDDIGIDRLKARPVTTQCIDCKRKQEAAERARGS